MNKIERKILEAIHRPAGQAAARAYRDLMEGARFRQVIEMLTQNPDPQPKPAKKNRRRNGPLWQRID